MTAWPQTKVVDPAAAIRKNNLGVAYMNQQRMAQALTMFREAQQINPKLDVARLNEGIALLNLQRVDEARGVLLDAAKRMPENPRAWYNLGLLYKNSGEVEKGIEAFVRAAKLAPDDADAHYFIGTLLLQAQRYAEAIAAFERAIAKNPFHVSAEFGLSRALQRTDKTDESRKHLARFQQLTQDRLGAPMSLAYGDQGPLSLAEIVKQGQAAPSIVGTKFERIPPEAIGIRFAHVGFSGSQEQRSDDSGVTTFSSAGCVFDFDGDGNPDLLLLNTGKDAASALFRNIGGRFQDATASSRLVIRGFAMSCAAGDFDNDGHVDLAVGFLNAVQLFRNLGNGTFEVIGAQSGIHAASGISMGVTFLDYDHDGDLDLYVSRMRAHGENEASDNLLWRNNGNKTFTDQSAPTGLGEISGSMEAAAFDFNNDRAIDLLVPGSKTPSIALNQREGKFKEIEPFARPLPDQSNAVAVLDFDHDGWIDVAIAGFGRPCVTLWRNHAGKELIRTPLPGGIPCERSWSIAAVDLDNDGWVDLAVSGESMGWRGSLFLLRNCGPAGFEEVTNAYLAQPLTLIRPRAVIASDFDADGDTDLILTQNGGPVVYLLNAGGNKNNALRLSLKGLADNKGAIGTKVEVFAGTSYQKFEVTSPNDLLIGLGAEKQADVVRLLWPTGVLQDEVNLVAGKRHVITEIDRRGSSCPILFAWNGEKFEFIADMIGPGIVGHWVAPGERNIPDPTEYLKIAGASVRPRNGRLEFRFIEPMEEVVYLDQARLLAVDHPADVDIYPNERFAAAPPFPEFKVIASKNARSPAGAWDDRGRNVLPELLHRDRHYVTGFADAPFKGFASTHSLELDLGEIPPGAPVRLLMHGFTDYFTATSVYAAQQAGVTAIVPRVDALTPDGKWIRVSDDIGFPAGLARTMVADLTGKLPRQSAGGRRIRITTNLKIYWDQILIETSGDAQPYQLHDVALQSASLRFFGYPREITGTPKSDLRYRYEEASATGPYARHAGNYTRYGDVTPLLRAVDDRFVIFGSADEVALAFDPRALPALPAGWTRDYFFFAHGYSKDMDFYAAYGYTVDPLPFGEMKGYPYREEERAVSGDELNYLLDFNTRAVAGAPPRKLRFEFPRQR